jgi:hypothetical protein
MSEELCERVAQELTWSGMNAVSWDSGGGMFGVGIAPGDTPPDELRFFFGTAGSTWAGELLDDDGETIGELHTDVSSDSAQPREIASGVLRAIADFARTRS